jgi:hypothetical protein
MVDKKVDALYVTRFQKERWVEKDQAYPRIDRKFLNEPKYSDASVMHPLPRVGELDVAFDSDKLDFLKLDWADVKGLRSPRSLEYVFDDRRRAVGPAVMSGGTIRVGTGDEQYPASQEMLGKRCKNGPRAIPWHRGLFLRNASCTRR